MSARASFLLAAFTACLFSTAQAFAAEATSCQVDGSDQSDISDTLGEGKPDGWWQRPCKDEECRAIHDLSCAAAAVSHTFLPNFMAYRSRREAELALDKAERTVQALGSQHPRRIPLYCKLLARVAPKVRGQPDNGGYDMNAYYLTSFALRLDRPGNHCLANVVAAVPDTPAAQASMQDWATPCLEHIKQCQAQLDSSLR